MTNVLSIRKVVYFTGAMLSAAISSPSHAAAVISFDQVAGDVVATGSGSINVADLLPSFSGYDGFIAVSGQHAYAVVGSTNPVSDSVTFYTGATGPASFGTSSYITATTGSGDKFGVDAAAFGGPGTVRIWVSPLYKSGTALSSTDTWAGATFASLGLTPGVYTYSWGTGADADTLQVRIGAAVTTGGVPEPATWAMMVFGFGVIGATARRRTKLAFAEL